MIQTALLTIFAGDMNREHVIEVLKRAGYFAEDELQDLPPYSISFNTDAISLSQVTAALRAAKLQWTERIETKWSDSELCSAKLLHLWPPQGIKRAGIDFGTQYDFSSACAECGTGALQIGSLRLPARQLPKKLKVFQTADGEIVVAEPLSNSLRALGVGDMELRETLDTAGNSLPFRQLIPSFEMPPCSGQTEGLVQEGKCMTCGRDGYYKDLSRDLSLVYKIDAVEASRLPVITRTFEHFGKSRLVSDDRFIRRFAPALVLVQPSVYAMFAEHRVRDSGFFPVHFS